MTSTGNTLLQNTFIDNLLSEIGEDALQLADFDFELPKHLIATTPRPTRSCARLLHVDKANGRITHSKFQAIDQFFSEGDLFVFNDTKIIASHLLVKNALGLPVDLFVERVLTHDTMFVRIFKHSELDIGDIVMLDRERLEIVDKHADFYTMKLTNGQSTLWTIIETHGKLAFPTYFGREATAHDLDFFQNIYAEKEGSVSAPSAGFHFDAQTFEKLQAKKIATGFITLHVGSGTSAPIHVDDISKHKMHTEWLEVSRELCDLIKETKRRGRRVIAIGTTSLRALETASKQGEIMPFSGYTDMFIRPGYQFQCIDGLFTNFHLPRSTLMILISALAGYQPICKAYKEAIAQQYRFLAYGDAMLIT